MDKQKIIFVLLAVFILLAVGVGFVLIYKPFTQVPSPMEEGENPISGLVESPAAIQKFFEPPAQTLPKTNPFLQAKTNPFRDIKTNPFD